MPFYFQWCSYGSFVRYAFEGSLISAYGETLSGAEREQIPCAVNDTDDIFGLIELEL